jgi:hypothetical protein
MFCAGRWFVTPSPAATPSPQVIEHFTGREDFLYYRSAVYEVASDGIKQLAKLTEKFHHQCKGVREWGMGNGERNSWGGGGDVHVTHPVANAMSSRMPSHAPAIEDSIQKITYLLKEEKVRGLAIAIARHASNCPTIAHRPHPPPPSSSPALF